jgi:multidrug efflux system outer membrane protein
MKACAAGCALLLLSGCNLGPFFKRPTMELPPAYHRAVSETTAKSIADVAWWQLFDEPQLVALIEEALRGNLDLRLTAAQIMEAQALVASARAGAFPKLSGQVDATRGNDTGRTANSFSAALALSWELDFWGRYARAAESARATLLATEEGRNAVVASLVSAVAQQYLQLKGLRQRLEVVRQTAAAQRDSLALVRLLSQQGVQSAAEETQAESQLLTTENQIPPLERQVAQTEHALALLLGLNPRAFDTGSDLQSMRVAPEVPAGIPSQLLERRPDIRQAEQRLVAANANVGVARAQFFPTISLTGLLGRASPVLQGLVNNRGTSVASVGGGLLAPIFTGGALTANYEAARARAEQAAITYQQTVLVALREVSDALVAYDRDRAEADGNRARAAVAAEYQRLADMRFRSGVISYLEVLDAQRQLLAAQLDLNASELNQRVDVVTLYRALGGGWRAAYTPAAP